jgi:hypothetical protein
MVFLKIGLAPSHLKDVVVSGCIALCVAVVAYVWVPVARSGVSFPRTDAKLLEGHAHSYAVQKVMPEYPLSSLRAKVGGVAVALIAVSPRGKVMAVKMLEWPDQFIKSGTEEALWKWEFNPLSNGSTPMSFQSKVTLYFEIKDDAGRVRTAFE